MCAAELRKWRKSAVLLRIFVLWLAVLAALAPAQVDPQPAGKPKVVHAIVVLCDNKNQGIVPVPAVLGNGQDPARNLYWGAMYGVRTFFRKSEHWREVHTWVGPEGGIVREGAVFVSRTGPEVYVVAEAFDGAKMEPALRAFLSACNGGVDRREIVIGRGSRQVVLPLGSRADMICFLGHNGLMDMAPPEVAPGRSGAPHPGIAVVLACRSRDYFTTLLEDAKCRRRVVTTQLMSPEAYTLDGIVRSWALGDTAAMIREAAAAAYAKYQKCSLAAARSMFISQ
jgi:hypothetical protein